MVGAAGEFVRGDGAPAVGRVEFAPSTNVGNATDDLLMPPGPVTVILDDAGEFSVTLYRTDDPDWTPSGWLWEVTERIAGTEARTYSIELASATAELADLAPVGDPATPTQVDAHAALITGVHGIADTSVLETDAGAQAKADAAEAAAGAYTDGEVADAVAAEVIRADGAYAPAALATVLYDPATQVVATLSASAAHSTINPNLQITFTPTTSQALIIVEGFFKVSSASSSLYLGLLEGSTVRADTIAIWLAVHSSVLLVPLRARGLTPGVPVTLDLAWRRVAGTATLTWFAGGPNDGVDNTVGPPTILTAYAVPA